MRLLLALVLTAACADTIGTTTQALITSECHDPRDYGAAVDDGVDDRLAIQAAIDAAIADGKPVCLPAGRLHATKRPEPGTSNIPSLKVSGARVTIRGQGAGSEIAMLGASGGPGSDWTLLELKGSDHRVTDLMLDGSERTNTGEQTHLIVVAKGSDGVRLDHLTLNLPDIGGGSSGGDCIRLLGEVAEPVRNVAISDVTALACDRSALQFQRAVYDVWVDRFVSRQVGDQAVDMEPTGVGGIANVTLRDSTLNTGRGTGISISVSGNAPGEEASGVLLERVTTDDGGVYGYCSKDLTISASTIRVADTVGLNIRKCGSGARIIGSTIERLAGATSGPVVLFEKHNSGWPSDSAIIGSTVIQRSDAGAIKYAPGDGVLIAGSVVECAGPSANTWIGVTVEASTENSRRIRLTGNNVRGNCKYGFNLGASGGYTLGAVAIVGNAIEASTAGVRFGAAPTVTPIVDGNVVQAPTGVIGTFIGTNSP
jgi:hypothetical protein